MDVHNLNNITYLTFPSTFYLFIYLFLVVAE